MTDLHVKGAINSATGKVKGVVGRLTGDRKLQAQGKVQQVEGTVQGGIADIGDAVKDVTKDVAPDAPPKVAPVPTTDRRPIVPVPTQAATEAEGA